MNKIRNIFPFLFIKEQNLNNLKFNSENNYGFVEYKRNIINSDSSKIEKLASQMKWRILQNTKNYFAIYYIGIDDNGTIIGVPQDELIENIKIFVKIASIISASICYLKVIYINELTILMFKVKLRKIFLEYDINIDI
jgi:GTPase